MARILKYLLINVWILGPKKYIKLATRTKRSVLEKADASIKIGKLMEKAPAAMVNSLNGMGVNPAMPTAQASHF